MERKKQDLERPNLNMMVQFPVLLAIDPSVNNLGWACYDFSRGEPYDISNWSYGLIHPKGKHLQHKWKDAYLQLREHFRAVKPTHYACEWPMYFGGEKGKIAAQEGYTINIAGMAAFIAGRFQIRGEFISLWTPVQWKGSVPKYVTERKFIRLFGEQARRIAKIESNDVIDAIMIAEFWIDLYLREKFSWQHHPEWLRETV
jgi:hypothetical protein